MRPDEAAMLSICRSFVLGPDADVIVPEPYIPFIPETWNGVLVLAEAQNLATDEGYKAWLLAQPPETRLRRLPREDRVGVQPWDDGSLQLAVRAALSLKPEQAAVSNAVPWSQRERSGRNKNPEQWLIERASRFWSEMLRLVMPSRVVASGGIAQKVVTAAREASGGTWAVSRWRLPSPQAMSRMSGMFREKDLLSRFPEVRSAADENPSWLAAGYRLNKVFFACHAVSAESGRSAQRHAGDGGR